MQRCDCTVRLSGDVGNTVFKTNVSPAEIAVLTAIHGEGSVVDIKPTIMDKTPHAQERERLKTTYGPHVVDRLFPGEYSPLPVTLKDIAKAAPADEEEEPVEDAAENVGAVTNEAAPVPVAPEAASGEDEDEDDRILRESVETAKSKADLRAIAKDNDVDLSDVEDKMDALKRAILVGTGLDKE